nr:hypothetical protein [Tanacetum cinerariifolium]
MLYVLRVEMVINSPWMLSKNWLLQKQTAFGKDISNPFMADNLPKIVWFSTHHVTFMKSWLVQKQMALGQTATGKESSNPFKAEKSDASEGFTQIIDFLSRSYIYYALTVSPHIYISCIKQFWNTAVVKHSGVVCLPNEEIFAVICLSKGQRFNFSRYIFDSLVRNVDSSSKFYMYPRFIQLIILAQVVDLSSHSIRYISPALTQKVFANMRRVRKGFSGVEIPLFENMLEVREVDAEEEVQVPAQDDVDQENVTEEIADDVAQPTSPLPPSPVMPSLPPHQSPRPPSPQAAEGSSLLVQQVLDKCSALVLRDAEIEGRQADIQAEIYNIDLDNSSKVLSMQKDDAKVQEAVEIVTTAKLITEVVTAAVEPAVVDVSTPISDAKPAAKPKVLKIVPAATAISIKILQKSYKAGVQLMSVICCDDLIPR